MRAGHQRAYPMQAYLFVAFSTKAQRDGNSIARQVDWAKRWCAGRGISLDDTLTLLADGISRFRGAQRTKGGLATFLDACKQGRIKKGSYLIVENLDRLSREHPLDAMDLVRELVHTYGIRLITIAPEMEYNRNNLAEVQGIIAYVEFMRGHSESAAKSFRSADNWQRKRKGIGNGALLTRKIPHWLRLDGGRIVEDKAKCDVVRRIFALSRAGWGTHSITRKLNGEQVPPFGSAKFWHESYVEKALHNPAVTGVFQPRRLVEGRYVPDGPPVEGYFPVVVSPEDFQATQRALASRRNRRGRISKCVANLFTGLTWEGGERTAIRSTRGIRYLQRARQDTPGVRYDLFERCLLYWLAEVKVHLDNGGAYEEAKARAGKLAQAIAQLEGAISEDEDLASLLPKLASMKREHKEALRAMDENAVPLQSQFLHSRRLLEALALARDEEREALRRELRQAIGMTIKRIDVTIEGGPKQGKDVLAIVTFKDGSRRAVYFVTKAGRIIECGLGLGEDFITRQALQEIVEATGNRPFPVDTDPQEEVRAKCRELRAEGLGINEIAARLNLHRTTVWRHLREGP